MPTYTESIKILDANKKTTVTISEKPLIFVQNDQSERLQLSASVLSFASSDPKGKGGVVLTSNNEGSFVIGPPGDSVFKFEGKSGSVTVGGNGKNGVILLKNPSGKWEGVFSNQEVFLKHDQNSIILNTLNGNISINRDLKSLVSIERNGTIWLGGNGTDGKLVLFGSNGDNKTLANSTINLDGKQGNMLLGGNGTDGDILLFSEKGNKSDVYGATIHLDGHQGNIHLGGNGTNGDLMLFPQSGNNMDASKATIHLDGNAGDIILRNADCAESFDIVEGTDNTPGTVMVIDDNGKLKLCEKAYDDKSVGVVSGAGDYKPGIILDGMSAKTNRSPIALMGKVYCKVDASFGAIFPGDLLTTSSTPGHAMKVQSRIEAVGAIIGKALQPLENGTGLISIVVSMR